MHPDLLTEAEAAGLLVTLYKSMDEFIATVVEPTLPTSLKGFCQNSGLSRHGGKLTQKLGAG